MDYYNKSISELYILFNSSKNGLTKSAVEINKRKFGINQIENKKEKNLFIKILNQLKDFMVIILFIAAIISFITGYLSGKIDYIEPIVIISIIVINAIIGVIQEEKASKAIDALKKISSPHSKIYRDNKIQNILSKDLVVGDIIILESGDLVAADVRLIESNSLYTDESSLTGESIPVLKEAEIIINKDTPISEQKNMLISSSLITSGNGIGIITAVGMNSQIGKIAKTLQNNPKELTPLQKRLNNVSKYLGIGAIIICFVIFLTGILEGRPIIDMLMISISLAVAAIPEGLIAIVTIVLAIGVSKMVRHNVIVRKLQAVETLGCATVICSDKTGTLTQNKMKVKKVYIPFDILDSNEYISSKILLFGALCNNSKFSNNKILNSNPTDKALFEAFIYSNKNNDFILNNYKRILEIPFSSNTKHMTTVYKYKNNYLTISKGAVDKLLNKCSHYYYKNKLIKIDKSFQDKIYIINKEMSEKSLRVITICYKETNKIPDKKNLDSNLIFCGLVGIIDPPRLEVKKSISLCKSAGIRTVMITGDHIITAKAIANELNILSNGKILSGEEIEKLSNEKLKQEVKITNVFARVTPEDKLRIVKSFKENGEIVAMTGDGVNDAPALRYSDIGCAMGITGTEVAKNAADIILTDDNFSSIVTAVKFGRGIYDNIKRCIHFLLSSNIGEIITILFAFLVKLPTPLLPIHLLWVNLVTDSFPALALGAERVQNNVMERKPLSKNKGLFSDGMLINIVTEGLMIGLLALLSFYIGYSYYSIEVGRTMCFTVLSLSQIFHSFNMRSENSIFKIGLLSNIYLNISFVVCCALQISVVSIKELSLIFKVSVLNINQWSLVLLLSIMPIIVVEISKYFTTKKKYSFN
ncbi:MAG: calcium-translocating P-type ATPase, PMCA-type [Clostridia bacterium]